MQKSSQDRKTREYGSSKGKPQDGENPSSNLLIIIIKCLVEKESE